MAALGRDRPWAVGRTGDPGAGGKVAGAPPQREASTPGSCRERETSKQCDTLDTRPARPGCDTLQRMLVCVVWKSFKGLSVRNRATWSSQAESSVDNRRARRYRRARPGPTLPNLNSS